MPGHGELALAPSLRGVSLFSDLLTATAQRKFGKNCTITGRSRPGSGRDATEIGGEN